jgi:DNA-binding MltR family transcriptional regulator
VPDEPHWTEALDDIKEFFDDSPDRGIAISLPAIIDNRLTSILKAIMLPEEKLLNELFQPSGAFGNFKTKISLVYMLGLINKQFYQDLSAINKIRNYFAHRLEVKRLDQPPIDAWIKGMDVYRSLVSIKDKPVSPDDKAAAFAKALMIAELDTMRNCFRNCLRFVILRLNELERTLLAAKEAHGKAVASRPKPPSDEPL